MSCIDYWLISKAIDNIIEKVTIEKAPFSDHSAIYLSFCIDENVQGKGIWKMNTSILTTDIFRNTFQVKWN